MKYSSLPTHGKLIYITVVCYILTQLWKLFTVLFCWSGYHWSDWFALHASPSEFFAQPWTLLTYMFCHADLSQDPFHIIFNMLWLWWFGQFFLRTHSSRQFVSFYLTSGLFAGLFFLIVYNLFPYFNLARYTSWLVGASGAIFALIVAVAMREPEQQMGLNLFVKVVWVKMKWFATFVLLISLFFLSGGNIGGTVCHIGGALFGLIYGLMEHRGTDICAGPSKLIDRLALWVTNLRKPHMTVNRGGKREPISADKKRDMDYNSARRQNEAEIDAILEKISRHGYDGLTAEEKQLLFDASRRKQQKK